MRTYISTLTPLRGVAAVLAVCAGVKRLAVETGDDGAWSQAGGSHSSILFPSGSRM